MKKTKHSDAAFKLAVDLDELAAMLSCGKQTARKNWGRGWARIKIGRRYCILWRRLKNILRLYVVGADK